MGGKKYYWLKLKRDFFKRHDIQIIEAMDNGKDYVLFYLKILLESIDHEGSLRFSETIPYNEKMLSTITNTNIDTVKAAMDMFTNLGLVEILEDRTIYMNEVEKMLGTETYWAEQKRNKRKESNSNLKEIGQCPTCPTDVQPLSTQEIDIEIEKEKEIKNKDNTFKNKIKEYTNNENLRNTLTEFVLMRKTMKPGLTDYALKLLFTRLDKLSNGLDDLKIKILEQSIMSSYKGIFPIECNKNGKLNTVQKSQPQTQQELMKGIVKNGG